MFRSSFLAIGAVAAVLHAPAAKADTAASDVGASDAVVDAVVGDASASQSQTIIVTGRVFSADTSAINAPVVLTGEALARKVRPQLGDTLASMPGVSASSFAPGASRPVLRGFDAARVRVLVDGIGSLDASTVSADHAVAIGTLTVDRIDVLHGPEVLLYAGDPAGGAVNAIDKRIPRQMPENGYSLNAMGSYGSAADSKALGGALDVALAPRLALQLDASWNSAGDVKVGGNVLSPVLRQEVLAAADALNAEGDLAGAKELTAIANRRDRLPNSFTRNTTLGAGIAFLDEGGDLGVSVERYTAKYGIPPRPEVGGAKVSVDLHQTRIDTRGGVNLAGGFLQRIEFRGAFGSYQHQEIHGGQAEATFQNRGLETRVELVQARRGGWHGRSGVQFGDRTLKVIGEERLLPDNHTQNLAVFTLQKLSLGAFDFEAAGRYENVKVRAKPNGYKRGFNLWSGVAGMAWRANDNLTFHVDFQHGERAPSAEEMFVDGIHEASQSYQVGNPLFKVERSNGLEGGLRFQSPSLLFSVIGFLTDFDNFITSVPTGEDVEGFPVYQFIQAKARFRGVEAEGSAKLAAWGNASLTVDAGVDYTHASLVGIGPVPRIPPLRLRGGVEAGSPVFTVRGEVEWNARQSRVPLFENATAPFTLVGLSANWKPLGQDGPLTLILSGDNLLNVTGRRAASETRDFVPITGRDIRLTASVRF